MQQASRMINQMRTIQQRGLLFASNNVICRTIIGKVDRPFTAMSKRIRMMRPSGIREIMRLSAEMEKQDPQKTIIHMEVGQPHFHVANHVIESTVGALRDGMTTYIPSVGLTSLRALVAEYYCAMGLPTVTEQIIVTTGATASLFSVLGCLLNADDECLVPFPGFPNYQSSLAFLGARSVPYRLYRDEGYLPSIPELEKCVSRKTKVLLLTNPGNPTGSCFDTDVLQEILDFAKANKIFIVSDEIYSDIVFDKNHTPIALLEGPQASMEDSIVATVSGVSKTFAMTGHRVGWTRCSPSLVQAMAKAQEPLVSCGVPFAQIGAASALSTFLHAPGVSAANEMKETYRTNRDLALAILERRGRPSPYTPGGAFYLLVDTSTSGLNSRDFALKLLSEKHVAIAPGTAFNTFDMNDEKNNERYEQSEKELQSFCRVCLANSPEMIQHGINHICDLLDDLERKQDVWKK